MSRSKIVLTPASVDTPKWSVQSPLRLGIMLGLLAFLQSVADPAEGLFSQPTLSFLRRSGRKLGETTDFAALIALPWLLKPLFGLISDSLPILGSRRKIYLILSAFAALLGFLTVYAGLRDLGHLRFFLGGLMVATAGVAFSDVVSDAVMIEAGQPRGLTGWFQSIQWSSAYAATIATGFFGGWLSQKKADNAAIIICIIMAILMLCVSFGFPNSPAIGRAKTPRSIVAELVRTIRSRNFWAVAAFLFLWNFNPFTTQVLQLYATERIHLGEDFFGFTKSLFAVACLAAGLSYGFYCQRISMRWLIHASIVLGLVQTAAHWGFVGQKSAVAVTILSGFAYMTATLIQLDLAARICPPQVAGSAFALLMSLENLATTGSVWVGGRFYDWYGQSDGPYAAFNVRLALAF